MDPKLKEALKKINAKKSFVSFAREVLAHHAILKRHFVRRVRGDIDDYYDFDFNGEMKGRLKLKFELLMHILTLDECSQTELLLRKLGWFFVAESGFDIDQFIEEASFGSNIGDPRKHDVNAFTRFEKREWKNFVRYFSDCSNTNDNHA